VEKLFSTSHHPFFFPLVSHSPVFFCIHARGENDVTTFFYICEHANRKGKGRQLLPAAIARGGRNMYNLNIKVSVHAAAMERRWVRPLLCRLCEFPVVDGGVRVSRLDRPKLSEWWLKHLDTEFEDEDAKNVWICQFCCWDARYEKTFLCHPLNFQKCVFKNKIQPVNNTNIAVEPQISI